MDLCTVDIRLGGSLLQVVQKRKVSPAEIMILKETHGQDSVDILDVSHKVTRAPLGERQRLAKMYSGKSVDLIYPASQVMSSGLPMTLEAIGIERPVGRLPEQEFMEPGQVDPIGEAAEVESQGVEVEIPREGESEAKEAIVSEGSLLDLGAEDSGLETVEAS